MGTSGLGHDSEGVLSEGSQPPDGDGIGVGGLLDQLVPEVEISDVEAIVVTGRGLQEILMQVFVAKFRKLGHDFVLTTKRVGKWRDVVRTCHSRNISVSVILVALTFPMGSG